MKKLILGIVIASFLLMPVIGLIGQNGELVLDTQTASALEDVFPTGAPTDSPRSITTTSIPETLVNIANWIFYILIGVAVLFIVIAGLEYVTAQGDPDKIKSAGQKVLYALIGIIVAALAKGLVILVQYFPSASGGTTTTLKTLLG